MDARRAGGIVALVGGVALVAIGAVGVLGAGKSGPSATPGPTAGQAAASPSAVASPSASATASPTGSPSPAPTATPSPTPSPTPPATPDADARIRSFYTVFVAAIRSTDTETLLALLHPATLERYGAAACRATIPTLADPAYKVVIRTIHPPAPWEYARDGRTTTIPDAWAVDVDLTTKAGTGPIVFHVAPVDGEVRWFADCGAPLPPSPAPSAAP